MNKRDQEIWDFINKGQDSKAIQLIYRYSFQKIKRHVTYNSGNEQDAEDLFQDAIMVFYRYVKEGKFREENDMDAFLFTIAKNLWINQVKRSQKVSYREDSEIFPMAEVAEEGFERSLIDKEREQYILGTFAQLGEKCRELLKWVIYWDCTMKDLVEKMGFANEDSAKTQHYKCKQRLIALVQENSHFKNSIKNHGN